MKKIFILLFVVFSLILSCKSVDEVKQLPSENIIEKPVMSIEDKKGFLTMISIPDQVLSDTTIEFLRKYRIKSVILFKHNVKSSDQLKKLTSDLKIKVDPDILISIDQEGGNVVRIPWDETVKVTARMIGNKDDLQYAYDIAYKRAKFLLAHGINVILGPVADVTPKTDLSYVYSRSFGSDYEKVANMVYQTVKAQKDAGIITVLKHFPGHGKTITNSHYTFPVIDINKDDLLSKELLPFRKGIEAGAEMIMVGHIINPNIDSDIPASISPKYLNFLQNLNFNGVIITDDLKMTGKIDKTIGWGINLVSGSFKEIEEKINTITPVDSYLNRVIKLIN